MRKRYLGLVGLSLAALFASAPSAWALNDVFESSCAAPCLKPPKENLFIRGAGDFDANGATPTITGTLAKGSKKTVLKIDVTFSWFSLGNTFRVFNAKVNNRFAANYTILNWLDSCANGMCTRTMQFYYDMDVQELAYPGEFIGQPLNITFNSSRAVDNGSNYTVAIAAQVFKKK